MTCQDRIRMLTSEFIWIHTCDYGYKSFGEFSEKHKMTLYEMVLEHMIENDTFRSLLLLEDFLFGILNGVYVKTCREELLERLSDVCDPLFEKLVQEFLEQIPGSDKNESDLNRMLHDREEARAINLQNKPLC